MPRLFESMRKQLAALSPRSGRRAAVGPEAVGPEATVRPAAAGRHARGRAPETDGLQADEPAARGGGAQGGGSAPPAAVRRRRGRRRAAPKPTSQRVAADSDSDGEAAPAAATAKRRAAEQLDFFANMELNMRNARASTLRNALEADTRDHDARSDSGCSQGGSCQVERDSPSEEAREKARAAEACEARASARVDDARLPQLRRDEGGGRGREAPRQQPHAAAAAARVIAGIVSPRAPHARREAAGGRETMGLRTDAGGVWSLAGDGEGLAPRLRAPRSRGAGDSAGRRGSAYEAAEPSPLVVSGLSGSARAGALRGDGAAAWVRQNSKPRLAHLDAESREAPRAAAPREAPRGDERRLRSESVAAAPGAPPAPSASTRSLPSPYPARCLCRANTTGTLSIDSTLSDPDVRQTVRVISHVLFTHLDLSAPPGPVSAFDGDLAPPPQLGDVEWLISRIYARGSLHVECLVTSLILAERLLFHSSALMRLSARNWRSVVFSCMILASKFCDDESPINADWCHVCADFSIARINALEAALLDALAFNASVSASVYARYYFHLRSIAARLDPQAREIRPPLDVSVARKIARESSAFARAARPHRKTRSFRDISRQASGPSRPLAQLERLVDMSPPGSTYRVGLAR